MIARFKALSRNLASLELGENGGDRLAGLGDSSVVIVAEECRECSGDFVLCDGGDVGAFAERRGIGAEEGHPDVFRLREFLTVRSPVLPAGAAAVVDGKDERRGLAVFGHRLNCFPKDPKVVVHAMCSFEILRIAAFMSPIVSFAK